jgi:hypothetical protein
MNYTVGCCLFSANYHHCSFWPLIIVIAGLARRELAAIPSQPTTIPAFSQIERKVPRKYLSLVRNQPKGKTRT